MSIFKDKNRCPHCEVELCETNTETDVSIGPIRMVKCGMCETASTWIDGNHRSHTTAQGEQSFGEYTPFATAD